MAEENSFQDEQDNLQYEQESEITSEPEESYAISENITESEEEALANAKKLIAKHNESLKKAQDEAIKKAEKEISEVEEALTKLQEDLKQKKANLRKLQGTTSRGPIKYYDYKVNTDALYELYTKGTAIHGLSDLFRKVLIISELDGNNKATKLSDYNTISSSIRAKGLKQIEEYCQIEYVKSNKKNGDGKGNETKGRILYIKNVKNSGAKFKKGREIHGFGDVPIEYIDSVIAEQERIKKYDELEIN